MKLQRTSYYSPCTCIVREPGSIYCTMHTFFNVAGTDSVCESLRGINYRMDECIVDIFSTWTVTQPARAICLKLILLMAMVCIFSVIRYAIEGHVTYIGNGRLSDYVQTAHL